MSEPQQLQDLSSGEGAPVAETGNNVEIKPIGTPTENAPVLEIPPQAEAQNLQEKNAPMETKPVENGDWQQREAELLQRIKDLEDLKIKASEEGIRLELKMREEEIDLLRSRVVSLETELQASLSKPAGKNHEVLETIKQQHDELLSKARGMIFDKTKMVKNQELQIEALNNQVTSLKDINQITKDLLEIRNNEIKAMEDRLVAMEARFKAEKERYSLMIKRTQAGNNLNEDLKKEYETQLAIFKELREKYDQRVKALMLENEKLKDSLLEKSLTTSV